MGKAVLAVACSVLWE